MVRTSVFGAVAALAVLSGPVLGQGPLEFGVGASRNSSPPAGLSDDGCAADASWAAEGRVGLRLSPSMRLEGHGGYHFEQGVTCTDPVTIPTTGPFENTTRSFPGAGYPYLSTDARISVEPVSPAGAVWFRAFGGYGRMWGASTNYWLAGGGLVFAGGVTTVLEFEWNWFSLPFEDNTQLFQDGIMTSETRTDGSRSHTEFRIKAGFRFRL